jgi:hypothetical protein
MKLRLNIDELRVETFATDEANDGRGTVQGHEGSKPPNCFSGEWSCIPEASCGETCPLSCNPTCVISLGLCCGEES